jgi:hypothetical protein
MAGRGCTTRIGGAASPSRCCTMFPEHHGQSRKRDNAKEGRNRGYRDETLLPSPNRTLTSPRWSISRFRPFALSRSHSRTNAASPLRCCAMFPEHLGQSRKRDNAKEGRNRRYRDETLLPSPNRTLTSPRWSNSRFRPFALSRSHSRTNAASPSRRCAMFPGHHGQSRKRDNAKEGLNADAETEPCFHPPTVSLFPRAGLFRAFALSRCRAPIPEPTLPRRRGAAPCSQDITGNRENAITRKKAGIVDTETRPCFRPPTEPLLLRGGLIRAFALSRCRAPIPEPTLPRRRGAAPCSQDITGNRENAITRKKA